MSETPRRQDIYRIASRDDQPPTVSRQNEPAAASRTGNGGFRARRIARTRTRGGSRVRLVAAAADGRRVIATETRPLPPPGFLAEFAADLFGQITWWRVARSPGEN